jgi:hypothetical protein
MFENRVLTRIFGPKREEATGERRKLHSEDLRNLYSSSSIIRQIKSRRIRWAENVAHTRERRGEEMRGEERKMCKFWWERPKERDHSEDRGVGGRMG